MQVWPETRYITVLGVRLIFRDGKYHGHYHWRRKA